MPVKADIRQLDQTMRQNKAVRSYSPVKFADSPPVHIFSVGPVKQEKFVCGKWYRIQPKPEGKAYWGPIIVEHPVIEEQLLGDSRITANYYNAITVARDIVWGGESKEVNFNSGTDLRPFGVFIASGPEPSEAELERATELLHSWYRMEVEKGDFLYSSGKESDIPNTARLAARELNLLKPWMQKNQKARECPGCFQPIDSRAFTHTCGWTHPDRWKDAVENGMRKRADVPEEKRWWKEEVKP